MDFGKGFAFMHIPRLGKNYAVPVVQGVGLDDLARGIGHYPRTVMPGHVGNFAVAGHRATHGEPFAYLDKVGKGDLVDRRDPHRLVRLPHGPDQDRAADRHLGDRPGPRQAGRAARPSS